MTEESTPHTTGYGWLKDRVDAQFESLNALKVAKASDMAADDKYLYPIRRTLQQAVRECLLVALDHLRFVAWTLIERGEPQPYAQFTVVRTAITAGSTAMWMLNGDATQRRSRALEFYLNDFKSEVQWIDTVRQQPPWDDAPASERKKWDVRRDVQFQRQHVIVQMANDLLKPEKPFTRDTLARRTKDNAMVEMAGAATPALGMEGYDAAVTLLNTWQSMSGYAHARPWSASLRGRQLGAVDLETGMQSAVQKGDPDELLDAAFRALQVAERATMMSIGLSTA